MVTLISLIGRNGRGGGWEAGSTDYTEALVLNGETMIRLLGRLFTFLCQSVYLTIQSWEKCHPVCEICVFVKT
jgi:hypothetical protein